MVGYGWGVLGSLWKGFWVGNFFVGKYREYMGILWELTSYIETMINHYHKDPVHNHIKVNKKRLVHRWSCSFVTKTIP